MLTHILRGTLNTTVTVATWKASRLLLFWAAIVTGSSLLSVDLFGQDRILRWVDNTEKFSVEASFQSFDGKQLVLQRTDGKQVVVPADKLSSASLELAKRESDLRKDNKQTAARSSMSVKSTNTKSATTPDQFSGNARSGDHEELVNIQGDRNLFLVPVSQQPLWHDFRFMAALPAATKMNKGTPAVIALNASGYINQYVDHYIERYHPDNVILVGQEAEFADVRYKANVAGKDEFFDSAQNGHNGTILGATWSEGGLAFDGVDDTVDVATYNGVAGNAARTVTAWVKATAGASGTIAGFGSSTNNGQKWVVRLNDSGQLAVDVGGAEVLGATCLTDGKWHHVAAVKDSGATAISQIVFYVDGKREAINAISDKQGSGLTIGLRGYWALDDGGGLIALDSSGFGTNGKLHTKDARKLAYPGPVYVNGGKIGGCLKFNSQDQNWVEIPGKAHLDLKDQFSVSFWMKPDTTVLPEWCGVFSKGEAWYHGWYLDRDSSSQRIRMRWFGEDQQGSDINTNAPAFVDGQWTHVVMTYDARSSKNVTMYLNGANAGSAAIANPVSQGAHSICLGSKEYGGNTESFFHGLIDEVAMWSRPLTETDVAALYSGGNGCPIASDGTVIDTVTTTHLQLGSFEKSDFLRGTLRDVGIYNVALNGDEIASMVGAAGQNHDKHVVVDSSNLDRTTIILARSFWSTADTVVLASRDEYGAGLAASTLAARLQSPLFFYDQTQGISQAVAATFKELSAKRAIIVGQDAGVKSQLSNAGLQLTTLPDDKSVIRWMVANQLPVDYFAVCNINDRITGFTKKASLSAALLAASHQGAVVALDFEADFNHPFWYDNQTSSRPNGAADSASGIWYTGTVRLNDKSHPFVISLSAIQNPDKNNYDIINIDLNGNGRFGDAGELIHRADVVAIGGKRYSVATGTWERLAPGHVRFTYPTSAELKERLAKYYVVRRGHPKYMAMVGLPDVLPMGITYAAGHDDVDYLISDQPLANVDEDPFYEIAMGRILGLDTTLSTLLATRSVTYRDLVSATSARNYLHIGEFGDVYSQVSTNLDNVGFDVHYHTFPKELAEPNFDISTANIAVQDDHGGPGGFAGLSTDTTELLAPMLVEAGGCNVAGLDEDFYPATFGNTITRQGAVGLMASVRGTGEQKNYHRQNLFVGMAAGMTTGEAFLHGLNGLVAANNDNYYYYILYGLANYTDPALQIHIPTPPRIQPARIEVLNDRLIAHAPEKIFPWVDPSATDGNHFLTGPGLAALGSHIPVLTVAWTTKKKITALSQQAGVPAPLGWQGYKLDHNQDGTVTVRFWVRFHELDGKTGSILQSREKIEYFFADHNSNKPAGPSRVKGDGGNKKPIPKKGT